MPRRLARRGGFRLSCSRSGNGWSPLRRGESSDGMVAVRAMPGAWNPRILLGLSVVLDLAAQAAAQVHQVQRGRTNAATDRRSDASETMTAIVAEIPRFSAVSDDFPNSPEKGNTVP